MDPNQYASPNSLAHLLSGYTGNQLTQLETYLSGQDNVNSMTPPTFLFESWDDTQISSQNSSLFCEAMNTASVPSAQTKILRPRGAEFEENAIGPKIPPCRTAC